LDSSGCISADRVTVYVSGIALTKEPSTTSAATGDEITYSYTVKNTGDLNVSGIALIDDKLGAITGLNRTSLEPGETALATAHYVVKSSDLPGPLVNTPLHREQTDWALLFSAETILPFVCTASCSRL
jgi:hypothetical protein